MDIFLVGSGVIVALVATLAGLATLSSVLDDRPEEALADGCEDGEPCAETPDAPTRSARGSGR